MGLSSCKNLYKNFFLIFGILIIGVGVGWSHVTVGMNMEMQNKVEVTKDVKIDVKKEQYKVVGEQLIIELYGCDPYIINDVQAMEHIMLAGAKAANATVVAYEFHQFSPQGVSGAVIVAESHLAIHTWPEDKYCTLDIFTCGEHTNNAAAMQTIKQGVGATHYQVVDVKLRKVYQPESLPKMRNSTMRDMWITVNDERATEPARVLEKGKAWGMISSVDLQGCDPELIRSAEKIKEYVVKLCDLIQMKRFGECQVVNFGEDERVAGFSMTQLIETSLISGHFANLTNSAYIDVFSCKAYDPEVVAQFTKEFFKASDCQTNVLLRGDSSQKTITQKPMKIEHGVFKENYAAFGGMRTNITYKKRLESYHSPFQHIEVYETIPFGKMLALDGIIMLTEYDNYAYHEMIAHVPMFAHPNPERVLIVGGGDCGTLKEVLKHDSVKEVILCEIDEEVIKVSQKHFPQLTSALNDPRVKVQVQDAAEYIKTKQNYFDVICVDSTDFFGLAEVLYRKDFYENLQKALTKDGIAVTQSESMYYDKSFIARLYKQNKEIFAHASYYFTLVPTYPSGTIGFSYCSNKHNPFEKVDEKRIAKISGLKYYNAGVHNASFQLPQTVKQALEG